MIADRAVAGAAVRADVASYLASYLAGCNSRTGRGLRPAEATRFAGDVIAPQPPR